MPRRVCLLEEANQLLLRGRAAEASRTLDEASTLIYRVRHRRYGNLLSLRLAELAYRAGRYPSALHSVRSVRSGLDERYDRSILLTALGLELKLARRLDIPDVRSDLEKRLERLTYSTRRAVSLSILARSEGVRAVKVPQSNEDVLGALLNRLRMNREDTLSGSLEQRLLGPSLRCVGL